MSLLPYLVAVWLLLAGFYGVITSSNLMHMVVCLSVVQSSTYVLILAVGYRTGGIAPIFKDLPPGTPAVDPMVQALVLTDIVVGATVSALLLAIAIQVYKRRGTLDPAKLKPMRD